MVTTRSRDHSPRSRAREHMPAGHRDGHASPFSRRGRVRLSGTGPKVFRKGQWRIAVPRPLQIKKLAEDGKSMNVRSFQKCGHPRISMTLASWWNTRFHWHNWMLVYFILERNGGKNVQDGNQTFQRTTSSSVHPIVSIKSCVSSQVKGLCYHNCLNCEISVCLGAAAYEIYENKMCSTRCSEVIV